MRAATGSARQGVERILAPRDGAQALAAAGSVEREHSVAERVMVGASHARSTARVMKTTWDGVAVSQDPPSGASVVVYRRAGRSVEYLLLHRAHSGPQFGRLGLDASQRGAPARRRHRRVCSAGAIRGNPPRPGHLANECGMGLERLVMVLQGVKSVYETNLFVPWTSELSSRWGPKPRHSGGSQTTCVLAR